MRNLICLLFLSFSCGIILAQTPVSRHFPSRELSCDLITEICQDDDGFIWVGTINGLNRYDGWSFKHIYAREGDTTYLNSNYIYELFCDSRGRFWVGTDLGLQLYDRKNESFSSVHYPDGRRVRTEQMVELPDGNLWIVTGNVYRLDTQTMTAEPLEELNKLSSSSITEVFADSSGTIWLSGSRGKLFMLRGDDIESMDTGVTLGSFVECSNELFASSGFGIYHWNRQDSCFTRLTDDCAPYTQAKLLATRDGRLLATTAGQGFRIVDRESMTVKPMSGFRNKEVDLNGITIEDWIEDRSGNIWLGSTFNGLTMISNNLPDFISIGPPYSSTSDDDMMNAVYYDEENVVWGGTEKGELYRYDSVDERTRLLTLPGSIYSIYGQDGGHLLVGTKYNGMYVVDKRTGSFRIVDGTEGLYVKKILPCSGDTLVISLFSNGIAFYDKSTGATGRNIRAGTVNTLLLDRDGYIWCGTYSGVKAYGYYDRSSKSIQTSEALNVSTVYSLFEGDDGIIWIGTSGGLFSYDKAAETCLHHSSGGLKNSVICGIAGDGQGNLWISTFDGLIRYNPGTGTADTFKAGHGLYDTQFIRGSYYQDIPSGKIFFGARKDVTGFDPALIATHPLDTPPVLTGLDIFGMTACPGTLSGKKPISDAKFAETRKISLAYGDNDLHMFFSTMDFRETENIRAEYYLDKDKTARLTPTGSNMIALDNLKPGRHTLKVRLEENGNYSPASTLAIAISQPWYASWPALLAYLLIACGLAYAIWSLYRTFSKKKAHEKINEQKLDFFTLLCYELRSPLTLITIPLQKLLKNSYDDDTEKTLKSMQKNTEKVISLLNQSIDVRKIDEDPSSMQFSQVNIVNFISELLTGAGQIAAQQGVSISFNHGKAKIPVWIDRNSFSRAISNLIGNSLKATPKGGAIKIDLRKSDRYAEIKIQDSGKAFTQEQMDHIFKLPYRSASGNISGTDIGLYLDHVILNHHKGTLTASNLENGEGRQFIVSIPLKNSHVPKSRIAEDSTPVTTDNLEQSVYYSDLTSEESPEKPARGRGKYSVLAIDESEEICRYIHNILDSRFRVTTFTSAIEGYNYALTNTPDLIITDLMMPDLDGMTLLKSLKESTNTAHVPVMLLTSILEEDIRLKGLLTGADAIIAKPFNEEELILVSTNLIMSRSRLASRINGIKVTEEMLQPVELVSNNDVLIQKVINAINENISNPDLNIDMLTDTVGISRSHLHRKIKEITGMSPGEYIRSIRLNQAAELLKGQKKNISQISYSLGYSNPSVFSNSFKKFFGMTAKEYQDNHAETGAGGNDAKNRGD